MAPRVLFIAFEYPPLRASNDRIFHFTRHLAASGWSVDVLTVDGPTPYHFVDPSLTVPEGVGVARAPALENRLTHGLYRRHLLPFPNAFFLTASARGLALVLSRRPDVIVATTPQVSEFIAGDFLARMRHVPLVIDFRDAYTPPPPFARMFRGILGRAAGLVTTTDAYAEQISAHSGGRSVFVLPNGADLPSLRACARPRDPRFTVVYSGVLIDLYRVMDLLRAVDVLRDTVAIRVVVVGETRGSEHLVAFARARALPVDFVGRLDHREAAALSSTATVAYNGSAHPAGIGGKLYEAMALGLPTLGFFPPDSESARFVRRHGCGVVAHSFDELVQSLARLARSPDEVAALAAAGLRAVVAFDRATLAQTLSVYLTRQVESWRP